MILLLANELT